MKLPGANLSSNGINMDANGHQIISVFDVTYVVGLYMSVLCPFVFCLCVPLSSVCACVGTSSELKL